MNEPLVSVIVPVYKVEAYIHRCIDSILNQSYKNFELILINDGSPDNCGKICDEYAEKDGRVRVIHKENGGQSSARNAGLDIAKGEYIVFADSDDYVHTDYIKSMYKTICKNMADIVQCGFIKVYDDTPPDIITGDNFKELDKYRAISSFEYKVIPCAKLYKRDVIGDIRFPEGKINEDDATYYKFAYNADKICLIEDTLYFYYMSPNSTMRNQNKPRLDFMEIYNERLKFFEEKKEPYLLQKSYEIYTIVLMLKYSEYMHKKVDKQYIDIVLKEFKKIYKQGLKAAGIKNKVLMFGFRICPPLTGRIIGWLRATR